MTVASLTWAVDKPGGLRYSIFLVMMASLTFGTVLAINGAKTLRVTFLLLLLVYAVGLVIALLEITSGFRLPTSGLIGRPERYQWAVTSFFHNQNDFAVYVALWLPVLLAVPFFARRASAVVAAVLCSLVSAVCLLYTGSRTNLLAFALMVPSLLAVLALRKGTRSSLRQCALGVALLSATACTLWLAVNGALPILRLPGIGVQHWRFDTLGTEMAAGTGSGGTRLKLIEGGLTVALDTHLVGVGPGNAEHYVRQIPGLETVYNLHNWWLEILVNGGILVFAGYVAFYASLLYSLFTVATRTSNVLMALAATALFTALLGYLLGALSPSSAIHFAPMWIHFGLSLAVINLDRKCRAAAHPEL